MRERELKAQAAAEAAAAEAERESLDAEATFQQAGDGHQPIETQSLRMRSLREAGAAAQRAAALRAEATRHAETAAQLAVAVLREEREMADARESAERQARNYAEAGAGRRTPGGPLSIEGNGAPAVSEPPSRAFNFGPRHAVVTAAPAEDPNAESFFALDLSRNAASLRSARGLEADEANAAPALGAGGLTEPEIARQGPAWLYASYAAQRARRLQAPPPAPTKAPLLAIFSFEGGVSKTGLVATLSRAFGAQGERVVLADTTSHGLLPFYFGARELQHGVVRSFPAASGAIAEPLSLVSYDVAESSDSQAQREALIEEILHHCEVSDRVVLDISSGSNWLVRRIASRPLVVLVPMALDVNSVITMQAVERLFQGIEDAQGHPLRPYYLLHQFDFSVPLHEEVRESLQQQLGDRLLPLAIRRSPAVNEALAEGMTIVDHAPEAPVSQDFLEVAAWLRILSPPPTAEDLTARWSAP
jgi:cellulose synthase operon protein YhjQ